MAAKKKKSKEQRRRAENLLKRVKRMQAKEAPGVLIAPADLVDRFKSKRVRINMDTARELYAKFSAVKEKAAAVASAAQSAADAAVARHENGGLHSQHKPEKVSELKGNY